ncbi:Hsp20/alpha crystallin family protein [Marinirhabdus gelatinilytica]|uniref:Heat shock protein Hsp20 n=1 Tax=Marinirhabdus gelatinilytica TaxID=1703343 RepID=A0A370QB07_9FLAO|nr:Hsp20/alpha crystallin family protein [Marinirhabdus gelatinilytica]RDK85542.1 heat shock protein Hsp20 [Marinirhabdus gelatinilytica]
MNLVKLNNQLFPSFIDGLFTENRLDVPNYEKFSIPAVNISEKNTNFVIEICIPGISKEDVTIEIDKNILKVSSQTNDETLAEDTTKFTRKEFDFKNFERSFTLPKTIDTENISARHELGILSISLPKKEEEKAVKKMVEIS